MKETVLIPFVPGQAHGRLLWGTAPGREPYIAVLDAGALTALPPEPDGALRGLVIVDAPFLSHRVLRLRGWGLPMVLAFGQALPLGETVWLDGVFGRLSTTPLPPVAPAPPAPRTLCTADGRPVTLAASVGSLAAARLAARNGAAAIGLFRSELLLPEDASPPGRAFFRRELEAICEAMAGRPVTVRLLDVAPDKLPPWLGRMPGVHATLGVQGVRLYDWEAVARVVRDELDAIAALAAHHPLQVLLPYVTRREEVEDWAGQMRQRAALPVGTMLETPAAALSVDALLEVADFAALGCNDLMQCLFGANRSEPAVAAQFDFHAPALYRFLAQVIARAGGSERLQVNGLISQWPGAMTLLLGLGFTRFSVDAALIPWLAQEIAATDAGEARRLTERAMNLSRSSEVRALLGI
jgi:phosphoenolpyruvate-protein kinase (PTS system EI component)